MKIIFEVSSRAILLYSYKFLIVISIIVVIIIIAITVVIAFKALSKDEENTNLIEKSQPQATSI